MAALGEKDESSTGGSSQIGNMVTQGVAVPPPSTLVRTYCVGKNVFTCNVVELDCMYIREYIVTVLSF